MKKKLLSICMGSVLLWGSGAASAAAEATLTSIVVTPMGANFYGVPSQQFNAFGYFKVDPSLDPYGNGTSLQFTTGTFSATAGRMTARSYQLYGETTTTNLVNRKALIVGGGTNVAQLYDMESRTFVSTGSTNTARSYATATRLDNGSKVLIAGGTSGTAGLASAELYDRATGVFTLTGYMSTNRYGHSATLLGNGKVLLVGGWSTSVVGGAPTTVVAATNELYDPVTGIFSSTGSLAQPRYAHTATLLGNGKVLIAGGRTGTAGALDSTELYDPATGQFSPAPRMTRPMAYRTAVLLDNGKVLLAGGEDGISTSGTDQAELYDPAANTFTAIPARMTMPRYGHTATSLGNGNVLITGGGSGTTASTAKAELYDPVSNVFSATGTMTAARIYHAATDLGDGMVMLSGGKTSDRSAELYTMAATWTSSNPSVASVNSAGLVTNAGGLGTTIITATSGTISKGVGVYNNGPGPAPDVVVSVTDGRGEFSPPITIARGSSLSAYTSHSNLGGSTPGGAIMKTALYLSTDETITTADTFVGDVSLYVPGNFSSSETITGTVSRKMAPGMYYMGVIADYLAQVPESNELNNTAVVGTMITVQ